MTLAALRGADADDATLLRRARRGDRRAYRVYSRRHAERAVELVELLVGAGEDAAGLSAKALSEAIAGGVAGDDALVRCAVRVTAPFTTEAGLARLVAALSDGDGRTEDEIAALIDRPSTEVSELRTSAYAEAGPAPVRPRECRGWPLVARKDRLTAAERAAADGHVTLCRQCRVRLHEQQRNRDKLWLRGGAVSTVVLADVISLSLPAGGAVAGSGFASVVLGKAGMAIVGATALAVTATSAGVAVARSSPSQPHRPPAPTVRTQHPGDVSPSSPASNRGDGTTTGSLSGGATTASAPPSKTQSAHLSPGPTAVTAVPTISVPVQVPTSLPTSLPTLLPLPTPSVRVSVPPLPLPTGKPLLGH